MKFNYLFAIGVLLLIITSCSPTPYMKLTLNEGYSETQLDTNVYKVIFKGNSYTEIDITSDFLLLRCAEVTLENGFQYFSRAEDNQYNNNLPSKNMVVSEPRSISTIICYKKKQKIFTYNAKFIVKSIRKKYNILDSNDLNQ